ncbi:hypothetical protein ACLXAZ_33605, partial [Escherichia coli]
LLGVTKQALNIPLRQLLEMNLIGSATADDDKRKRLLLGVTKQALNIPLRQLLEMNLIGSATADDDKR